MNTEKRKPKYRFQNVQPVRYERKDPHPEIPFDDGGYDEFPLLSAAVITVIIYILFAIVASHYLPVA